MIDDPLLVLWRLSILLSLLSLAVLLALVVSRFFESLSASRRGRQSAGLVRLLIEISHDTPLEDPSLMRFARNRRLAAQALVEFSTLVRGAELQQALDRLREAKLGRRLLGLLRDTNRETRLVAMEALGLLIDDRAERALLNVVRRSHSLQETVTAARALQSAGRGPGIETLLSGLRLKRADAPAELASVLSELALNTPGALEAALDDKHLAPSIRVQIIQAIGRSGNYQSLGALERLAQGDSADERAAAVAAMGAMAHPDATRALARATKDADAEVRAEAAAAIGYVAAKELTGVLSDLLSDKAWAVRFNAAEALLRLGPDGRARLVQASQHPKTAQAGRAAAMVLAERAG